MLTKNGFATLLENIRRKGAELDRLIAHGIEYASAHALEHGNFDPFEQLQNVVPTFARSVVRDARKTASLGAKGKITTDADTISQKAHADLTVRRTVSAGQRAKATRTANKGAPAADNAPPVPDYFLKGHDKDTIGLSKAEYDIALGAVLEYRASLVSKPKLVVNG
jgi:hypothetical protein